MFWTDRECAIYFDSCNENLTRTCRRTGCPLCSIPATNVGVKFDRSMKNIAVAILVVGALLATKSFLDNIATSREYAKDGVKRVHKSCVENSDCIDVRTKCACSCGGAINHKFAQEHERLRAEACNNYSGPICDMNCYPNEVMCVEGSCQKLAQENPTSLGRGQ